MTNPFIPAEAPNQNLIDRWWTTLFNASLDAQIICRADGSVQHANPKARRLFKLPPGTPHRAFSIKSVLPPAANQILESIPRSTAIDPQRGKSLQLVFDDGASLVMDLDFIPLGGGSILINFRDTTMSHRLESHVQRLITAIDATPDVFLVTDKNFQITYVNPAFQTATGYGIEEVIGRTDDFLRAPAEQERVRDYLHQVSQGQEWVGELTNLRSNGETYLVESTISPIFDLAGAFMGYVTSERDITLRKKLQEELRQERDFAESILKSLDSAIYSLDREFRLTHANDGWRQMPAEHGGICLNGAPEIGRALIDYVPDAGRRMELLSSFQQVLDSGKAQANFYQAADGRYWAVNISPWVSGSQNRGLILSVEDHTVYHQVQNQLFQSQKMEIIGTLAAGVAHDFNNLLQVIIGHVQLLQMQARRQPAVSAAISQGLDKISLASFRARDITTQLLSFSRAQDERPVVVDFNQVIADAARLGRGTLRENIVLRIQPAAEPIEVRMDFTRASQALLNLFTNAQDAMPAGGRLTLTNAVVKPDAGIVERQQLHGGREYARCSVTDTGGGIPAEVLPKIFQSYFSTKSAGKGTGLGLPIAQRIVQEAGGFIEVESVLGEGSTFHLYLPLAREQIAPTAETPKISSLRGTGQILVVDDVELLRDFAQNFLEMAGFTVLTAKNGEEAIQILENSAKPVDIILTDYNMPSMNGVDLVKRVSARWPKIKFILASGYLDEKTQADVRKQNATPILKPYTVDDLIKVIMKELAPH
jgi:PAS domain S-box-containing protein